LDSNRCFESTASIDERRRPSGEAASRRWSALVVTSLGALLASLVIALSSLLRNPHTRVIDAVCVLLWYLRSCCTVLRARRRAASVAEKPCTHRRICALARDGPDLRFAA
jgi:Flp pilus assembly protein TadB